jgi:hypothetical protein
MTLCSGNGYGYKSMEAAGRAFDNCLFYEEHYAINDDEPCNFIPSNYLSALERFKKFRK